MTRYKKFLLAALTGGSRVLGIALQGIFILIIFPLYVFSQTQSKPLQETGIGITQQDRNYNFNMGYRFTADNDGDVIELGGRWKNNIVHTVRLYAYPSGTLLAQVNVTGSMNWSYVSITPVSITTDSQYVVAVRLDAQSSGVNTNFSTPVTEGGITITNSTYLSNSNAMPINFITTIMYGQADITFSYTPCTFAGTITADNIQINTGDSTNLYVTGNIGNIQWQSSPDSIIFTDITGETDSTLNSGPLSVATFFRTYVTGGSCGPDTSQIIKITVSDPEFPLQFTGLGITSQNQNWNYNMGYKFTPSVGGQVSELGGRWKDGIVHTVRLYNFATGALLAQANVTGSMSWSYVSISPVTLSTDSQYVVAVRLDAQASGVSTNFTTPVVSGQVTIHNSSYLINSNDMPTNVITNIMYGQADIRFVACTFAGDISATDSEVCPGDSTTINVTDNIGDIQWQSSTNNITFTDISGETDSVLNTGPLSVKTYYRTYVTGGGCGPDTSKVDSVAVTGSGGTPGLWTASIDDDWNNLCNWDNAVVPVNGDSATIPLGVSPPVNIPQISLKYLEINNAAGIGLTNKMTITEELRLTAGNINTGSDTLVLAASAIITGGVSTSYIQVDGSGIVRKNYAVADGSTFTFPIGDVNDYSPVTFDLNSGSTLGADPFITINITDAIHPNIGNPDDHITRYWTISANDITTPDFDITCQYVDPDIVGTESDIITQEFVSSSGWIQYNPTNTSTNTLSGDNLTSFGDISGGDAITIVSTLTGDWNVGSTWLGGVPPSNVNNVSIQHVVSLTADTIINSITITASGTLNAAGNKLTVNSNFTINGSFDGTGEIEFTGSSPQSIAGSGTTFNNLTINNTSSGVNITSGAFNLTGTLTLTDGAFNTNNALTLISNALGTARIAEIAFGSSVSGDITMQRFVPAGSNSWRFLSSPVSGRTLADWNDNFGTSGFPGSDDPGFSFTSIYTYDETVLGTFDNGYMAPSGISDAINVGEGYWVYLGPLPLTFDVTGPTNTGNISLPVTYTDDPAVGDTADGWNMVANPYPSSIDWDAGGWTKTNINTTFYIYKNDGSYASYPAGGPGANGGTKDIASSQGFWVHTNAAGPALTVTENVKSTTDVSFLKTSGSQYDYIKLSVTGNSFTDETVIRFVPGSDTGIDNNDGYKFINPNPQIPNIWSMVDAFDLVINSIPELTQDLTIPVRVTAGATGSYTIDAEGVSNIASNTCILLEDIQTGITTDLKTDSTYTFTISDTTIVRRFLIHFNLAIAAFTVNTDIVSEGENIQFDNTSTGTVSYTWNFGDGSPNSTATNPNHTYNSEGTYDVTLVASNNNCSDTYQYQITVLDAPVSSHSQSLPSTLEQSSIVLLTSEDGVYIEFNFDELTNLNIAVYNLLGQKVTAGNNIRVKQDRIRLDLPNKVRGIYFIKIEMAEYTFTQKLVMR